MKLRFHRLFTAHGGASTLNFLQKMFHFFIILMKINEIKNGVDDGVLVAAVLWGGFNILPQFGSKAHG